MKRRKLLIGAGAFTGMLILILDGKTAIQGAQYGMELCLRAAVPALFPFLVLSILLTNAFSAMQIPLLAPIGRWLGIPLGCESLLISAFLGGYPAGAQCAAQLYQNGNLNRDDAERLLAFCSNAGPAFLFGIVGPMFPEKRWIWTLWTVHILSAIPVALIVKRSASQQLLQKPQSRQADAIQSATKVMAGICAWIILFRMIITFLERWILWLLPVPIRILVSGILELSNGCMELAKISDVRFRFLLCAVLLSFGGVCVTMQTISVTQGLSVKYYLPGKMIQTILSLFIALGLGYGIWFPALIAAGILLVYITKKENICSIQQPVGV